MQILGTVLNLKRHIKHSNMVQGRVPGTGPSLHEKQNKATRDQIRRAQRLGDDLIREDLCDEDDFCFSRT